MQKFTMQIWQVYYVQMWIYFHHITFKNNYYKYVHEQMNNCNSKLNLNCLWFVLNIFHGFHVLQLKCNNFQGSSIVETVETVFDISRLMDFMIRIEHTLNFINFIGRNACQNVIYVSYRRRDLKFQLFWATFFQVL